MTDPGVSPYKVSFNGSAVGGALEAAGSFGNTAVTTVKSTLVGVAEGAKNVANAFLSKIVTSRCFLKGVVMVAVLLYEGDVEQKQHAAAIHRIASDLGVPEEKIRTLYEFELQALKERARVKDYLVILVSRSVKDLMRRTNSSFRSQ